MLIGLASTYVDDTLLAGTKTFRQLLSKMNEKFDCHDNVSDRFTFSGIDISKTSECITLRQSKQAERLQLFSLTSNFKTFKSGLARLAWLCHTRPDICCAVAQLAQTTEKNFSAHTIRRLNVTIRQVRNTPLVGITHRKLDKSSLQITVFSDLSLIHI